MQILLSFPFLLGCEPDLDWLPCDDIDLCEGKLEIDGTVEFKDEGK